MLDNKNVNKQIFKDLNLTEEESKYMDSIAEIDNLPHNDVVMLKKVSFSILYLAKQIEASSKSNDKNSNRMFWLTLIIGALGLVQLADLILKLLGILK